jgi:hypothetical protein
LEAQGRTQNATREWGTWQQNWDAQVKPLVEEDFQPAADAFLEQVAQGVSRRNTQGRHLSDVLKIHV